MKQECVDKGLDRVGLRNSADTQNPSPAKGEQTKKEEGGNQRNLSFLFYDHAEEQPRRQGIATSTD